MTKESQKQLTKALELIAIEGEVKGEAELGKFLKRNVANKFDALNAKLEELLKKVGDIKIPEIKIPETDLSPVISAIKNIKVPQLKEVDLISLKPYDYKTNFQAVYGLLGDILKTIETNKIDKEEYKEIKKDLEEVKMRRPIAATMPQDWREDTTESGTLTGTANGITTTFVLRDRPVNNVVFVYRNGTLENLGGYSLSNKTITFNFAPQVGDNIQIKYPR